MPRCGPAFILVPMTSDSLAEAAARSVDFGQIEEWVEDQGGQIYVVRAVDSGTFLRALPVSSGVLDPVFNWMASGFARLGKRENGSVVGVLKYRGWRAEKVVHKEHLSTSEEEERVKALAQTVRVHGITGFVS